jgi:hypothetical protein
VAAPLIVTAARGVREIASGKTSRRRTGLRRLVPA